jgi:hypothetical protein
MNHLAIIAYGCAGISVLANITEVGGFIKNVLGIPTDEYIAISQTQDIILKSEHERTNLIRRSIDLAHQQALVARDRIELSRKSTELNRQATELARQAEEVEKDKQLLQEATAEMMRQKTVIQANLNRQAEELAKKKQLLSHTSSRSMVKNGEYRW